MTKIRSRLYVRWERESIGALLAMLLLGAAGQSLMAGSPVPRPQLAVLGPSQSDLAGLPVHARGTRQMHVLVLRVEFQPDELATTSGDGTFDLRTSSTEAINPPPHNRTYFDNQLRALAHYYRTVSNGKLTLSWEIYPLAEESSYRLPHDMKFYSGSGDASGKEMGWSRLLADAVQTADSTDAIDFSQFDCCIVFHAGVGADFELDLDPTPYDIQSAFVNLGTLRATLGNGDPAYRGIPVNQGTHFVQEGIILPETESQEGYEIGLLGPMAMLFGAQLGLPSLNDTDKNRPAIGRWGLMDQGSMNLQGLVPAQPCAWSKVFLGWEEAVELRGNQQGVRVGSALAKGAPRIYKIPINPKEYFLVENRQRDANRDGRVVCRDAKGQRVEILEDGRLLPVGWAGTIVQVDEYDFGLPGSGILIWHVDERVIEAGYADNRVNVNPEHRGVDLEECDAAQDIGYYFGFPTFGYDAGDYWDPWWAENESHKRANSSAEVVFGPSTMPNSRAYSGADTRITLSGFSLSDSVMSFDLRHEALVTGFPQFIGVNRDVTGLAAAPLSAGRGTALLVAATAHAVFAWYGNGQKVIANPERSGLVTLHGDTVWYPVALFAEVESPIAHSPALGDINGDGSVDVVACCSKGEVLVWRVTDEDHDGRADLLAKASFRGAPTSDLLLAPGHDPCVFVGTADGVLHAFSWRAEQLVEGWAIALFSEAVTGLAWDGQRVVGTSAGGGVAALDGLGAIQWFTPAPGIGERSEPVLADVDGDGLLEVVVVRAEGLVFALRLDDGKLLAGPGQVHGQLLPGAAAADFDGDGLPEVGVASSTGVYGFEATGVIANDLWLSFLSPEQSGYAASPPVAGDLDGDGIAEMVAYVPGTGIVGVKLGGGLVPELSFSMGGAAAFTPLLCDLDGDGSAEVVALSQDGFLYAWSPAKRVESASLPWPQYRADACHQGVLLAPSQPRQKAGRLFASRSVYCYPNPSTGDKVFLRYQLVEPVDRVNIRVYDLTGELVAELEGTRYAMGDNEVPWNVGQVQAGVYLGRVEATKGNSTQVELVRIAVVK
ncbi:MAG: FG-GAP-like repeat-containing protein [candidate division KSB1 bacterium]|nr:FG-GAP-like repeat-containing protein [candidate division KSB1 bacterium]